MALAGLTAIGTIASNAIVARLLSDTEVSWTRAGAVARMEPKSSRTASYESNVADAQEK